MSIFIINNTNNVVPLALIGRTVPASSQIEVTAKFRDDFAISSELFSYINDKSLDANGDPTDPSIHTLKINDGLVDLPPLEGWNLINTTYPKSSELQPYTFKPIDSLIDQFGNLQVSNDFTLFQSSNVTGKQEEIWVEEVTGGALSTYNQNKSTVTLSVGTSAGDEVIRQLRAPIQYYKGQMQEVLLTYLMPNYATGVYAEAGFGNSADGLFFGHENGNHFVMVRSSTSGSVVDMKVTQSGWNIDKLDGNGPSEITLDNSKVQLGQIDFSWLGVNVVEFHYIIENKKVLVHREDYTNKINTVYMKQAILPLRFVLRNDTAQASSSEMDVICQRVASRGTKVSIGRVRSVSSGVTEVSIDGNFKIVAAIRLKSQFKRLCIEPIDFQLLRTIGDETLRWRVLLNPTIAGIQETDWTDLQGIAQGINTTFQQATPYNALYVMDEGYIGPAGGRNSSSNDQIFSDIVSDINLGCNISGVQDVLALEVARITGNGTEQLLFGGKYREFI